MFRALHRSSGQFGFGRRSSFNLDRVLELAKSRRIVTEMLFDSAHVDGVTDCIANHLIKQYKLDQEWMEKKPELEGFLFTRDSVDLFSSLELSALKRTYLFVVGSEEQAGLISANYSELSSIISLSATTINEPLSIDMIKVLFANLTEYYVTNATKKQKMTYDIVRLKADSIGGLLALKEMEYAQFRDQNQGLYSNLAQLKADRLARDNYQAECHSRGNPEKSGDRRLYTAECHSDHKGARYAGSAVTADQAVICQNRRHCCDCFAPAGGSLDPWTMVHFPRKKCACESKLSKFVAHFYD